MLLKIQNQWINPQAIARVYQASPRQIEVGFTYGGGITFGYFTGNDLEDEQTCERDLHRILEAVNGSGANPFPASMMIAPDAWKAIVEEKNPQVPNPFTLPTEPVGGCHDFQVVSSEQAVRDVLQPAPVVVGRTDSRSFPNYPLHGKFESAVKGG